MERGINGTPGAAIVVPFTNRTPGAPCGPRPPSFFHWRDFKDWVVGMIDRFTVDLTTKADKVSDGNTGNLVGIGDNGSLVDSGLRANGLQPLLTFDTTPTAGSTNPVTSDGVKQAIAAATPSDYEQVKEQVAQNAADITAIDAKIPSQASAQNQLADKDFVNSSIATNTATFRGSYNLVSDLGLTVSATEQQVAVAIATKLASLVPPVVPENNDYCFVQVPKTDAEPTVIERIDRYKCTVTKSGGVTTRVWEYEWSLNNSSFTADQWAAINSGITSGLVDKLNGIEAGAQVNIIETVKVNGTALTPENKAVNVLVPVKATTKPVIAGNPAIGNSSKFAAENHVHPAETKVKKGDGQAYNRTLPIDCFPITYTYGGTNYTISADNGNAGIYISGGLTDEFTIADTANSAQDYGRPIALFGWQEEAANYNKFVSVDTGVTNLKFNGKDPTADTWPALSTDSAIIVRDLQVAKDADVLKNSGNQTLDGTLSVKHTRIEEGKIVYDVGEAGESNLMFPPALNDYIAVLSDMYAAVQQIAPAFEERTDQNPYMHEELVSKDGVVYQCDDASFNGPWAAESWVAKKVSEIFAPLASPVFTDTPTAPDADGQTPGQVANVKFVQGALPYAIAPVLSGKLTDRTVNVIDGTATAGITCSLPSQTANKSRDFYIAISCDPYPTTLTISNATLINVKGEPADLTLEAGTAQAPKTTVLRFTEVANGTTSPAANPVFVVTGGANGGGSVDPATLNTKANSTALAPDWRAGNVDTAYAVNNYITYNGNAYVCMVAYTATSSSPTPDNDIYNDTVTPATGHWKLTDMTTPDATLDITSQGSLRVVSAGGQTLWQQGYKLASASSATLSNEGVNRYDFAANATANVSLTLPTPPTDKVGDFVLDVTNPALDTASFTQFAFDSAQTYAVGAEVVYDSKIWRCVTAVSTAGAWTGTTNWEEAHPYFSIAGLSSTLEMVVPKGGNLSEILSFAPGTRCELYFTLTSFAVNSRPTWKVVRQDVEVVAS